MAIVTIEQLTLYTKTYLETLLDEIGKLGEEQKLLFEFQKEQPMRCVGFISQKHGAAVAFFPSEEESIEIRHVTDRIESIFPKDPNTGDMLLQVEVGPRITFTSVYKLDANLQLKNARFLQRKKELAILSRNLTLSVDESSTYIIEDRLILKGNNSPEKWSKDVAIDDVFYEIIRTLINKERKGCLPADPLKDLENRIKTFETLISSTEIRESEIQQFFEANRDFLHFGTRYKKIYPQIPLVTAQAGDAA
jgi:hypothetical protein